MAIVLVSASFILIGCNKQGNNIDSDTTESAINIETTAPETTTTAKNESSDTETTATEFTDTEITEPQESGITIVADGKIACDIVFHDKASTQITRSANALKNAFTNKFNVAPGAYKESMFKTLHDGSLDVPKIVVGAIKGDAYCDTLLAQLENDNDYIITVADGTLYIIGKTDVSTAVAVNKFIAFNVIGNTTDTLALGAGEVIHLPSNYKGVTIADNPLDEYFIVYYDSYYAHECAQKIQTSIAEKTGLLLPIVSEEYITSGYEILVGKTGRKEATDLRNTYDRPNVYYDVKVVGTKLVVMGEGYRTLTNVGNSFGNYINSAASDVNLTGEIITGDILADVDAVDCMTDALVKSDSADIRVLHWNLAAPLSWDQSKANWGGRWPFPADATGRRMRAEQQADTVLIYNPDIITTNEIYEYHAGGVQIATFKKEISDYFVEVDSTYDSRDEDKPLAVPETASDGAENPEKIFIRKGMFTVKDSGWRYLSDGTTFHGIHWAILETLDGKQFIVSGAHYGDGRSEVTYGSEHLSAINFAQKCSGSSTPLPVILTGDMFTWVNHSKHGATGAVYRYHESKGYNDAQVKAAFNCNDVLGTMHGTYHDPMNDTNKARASEDFVWYKNGLDALKFGVITLPESTNTSDHWPVFADLTFNK